MTITSNKNFCAKQKRLFPSLFTTLDQQRLSHYFQQCCVVGNNKTIAHLRAYSITNQLQNRLREFYYYGKRKLLCNIHHRRDSRPIKKVKHRASEASGKTKDKRLTSTNLTKNKRQINHKNKNCKLQIHATYARIYAAAYNCSLQPKINIQHHHHNTCELLFESSITLSVSIFIIIVAFWRERSQLLLLRMKCNYLHQQTRTQHQQRVHKVEVTTATATTQQYSSTPATLQTWRSISYVHRRE